MKKITDFIERHSHHFNKALNDQLSLRATEAAFYTIISIVPLLMFALSLLKYIAPINIETIDALLSEYLPETISSWITAFIDSIYSDASISLTSISAITTVWSASRATYSLTKGLRMVYANNNQSNTIRVRVYSLFLTIVFAVIIVISLVFLVFSNQLFNLLNGLVPQWLLNLWASPLVSILIYIGISTLLFGLFYKYLSYSRLPYIEHLPGALFTALTWMIFSRIYYLYINNYADYSIIYGSLAAIVLLMFWLRWCMLFLLIGAEINVIIADTRGHISYDEDDNDNDIGERIGAISETIQQIRQK